MKHETSELNLGSLRGKSAKAAPAKAKPPPDKISKGQKDRTIGYLGFCISNRNIYLGRYLLFGYLDPLALWKSPVMKRVWHLTLPKLLF